MKKKDSLIHLDHVAFSYRDASAILSDVSLEVWEWDIFLILWPSGVWKTTLLSIIGGIIKPTNGNTYYDPCLFPREKWFGYWLIDGPFFETLSVKENIFLLENFANSKIDRKYYRELLEYFELETYEMMSLISLSAGQRERVNLIRTNCSQATCDYPWWTMSQSRW
jgi:NitT/TauT family transport system ATP-binding protein